MHTLSKMDLSSDELETLRRSRSATVVVTANAEVQTNQEAQVCVHDLGLFVTVQLLEDTLAVLSLGKLCEEHGFSYEWASGQRPQLTKQKKSTLCRTDNFVPCLPRVVLQFRCGFVFNIASAKCKTCLHQVPLQNEDDELAPGSWGEAQNQKPKK